MQYYTDQGMPTRHLDSGVCAVCGNKLLVQENEEGVLENTYKLSCNHVYPSCRWFISVNLERFLLQGVLFRWCKLGEIPFTGGIIQMVGF